MVYISCLLKLSYQVYSSTISLKNTRFLREGNFSPNLDNRDKKLIYNEYTILSLGFSLNNFSQNHISPALSLYLPFKSSKLS